MPVSHTSDLVIRFWTEIPPSSKTTQRRQSSPARSAAIRHCGSVWLLSSPCAADAAFAYVNAFTSHVNVGFFHGAELADPAGLLQGAGKFMRHVKLQPGHNVDAAALKTLIEAAYADMQTRLKAE